MNPELDNQTPVGAGPAPTQNPFITPNPAPAPNPAPVHEPAPMAPQPMQPAPMPPKKKNTTTIVLVVILVLLIVGCGVAAAIMFWPKGSNNGGSSSNNGGSTPTTPDTPVEPEVSEEVELKDSATIEKIKTDFSTIMGLTWKDDIGKAMSLSANDVRLLKNGYLDNDAKSYIALGGVERSVITDEQVQNILTNNTAYFDKLSNNFGSDKESLKENFAGMASAYSGAAVREKYKNLFGEELAKGAEIDLSSISACGYYGYNEQFDIYFHYDACGGRAPYRLYYINKYTKDDNNAYIYISAGMEGEGVTYCDIYEAETATMPEVCAETSGFETSPIDESNYSKYAQYKITFSQYDDGNYYLEKAESL